MADADWPDRLANYLTFPFTVTREEDGDDAYFAPDAAKARFRLGHKMDGLELAEEDVDRGVLVGATCCAKTFPAPPKRSKRPGSMTCGSSIFRPVHSWRCIPKRWRLICV